MSAKDEAHREETGERADPSTGPGPGQPTGETLPGESEPTGAADAKKPDVGFGARDEETSSDSDA
jgi:hypothetical protein